MNRKYRVTLTAHGNIDHGQDPYSMLLPEAEAHSDTIEGCQKAVRHFIEENGLGAGNWTGGRVYDTRTGTAIGQITYNGRYWAKKEAWE